MNHDQRQIKIIKLFIQVINMTCVEKAISISIRLRNHFIDKRPLTESSVCHLYRFNCFVTFSYTLSLFE